MYGICHLSLVPCRKEPSNTSEMVTQLMFGEAFTIIAEEEEWIRIKTLVDEYESWINRKQFTAIKESTFKDLQKSKYPAVASITDTILNKISDHNMTLVMGSYLPKLKSKSVTLENLEYEFNGESVKQDVKTNTADIVSTAKKLLHAPYLWGGKTILGIDCSGLTQIVFRVNGFNLPRDAYQQAEIGTALSFVEEALPGDLAFFDNEEGKIVHVGIVIENQQLIHASGQVRIDKFDHYGIFHTDRKKYSHMLRVIKRVVE